MDSWAVGVLTFELLLGQPPFYHKDRKATESHISSGTPAIPAGLSEEAKHFLSSTLSKNPSERLTAAQMLSHPWIVCLRSAQSRQVSTGKALTSQPPDSREKAQKDSSALPTKVDIAIRQSISPLQIQHEQSQLATEAHQAHSILNDKDQLACTIQQTVKSSQAASRAAVLLEGKSSLQEYLHHRWLTKKQQEKQGSKHSVAALQCTNPQALHRFKADASVVMNVLPSSGWKQTAFNKQHQPQLLVDNAIRAKQASTKL